MEPYHEMTPVLRFSALIRKQHMAELHLGDFLVFLRRVVSSKAIQSKMASPKWTEVLLNIAAQKCCSGTTSATSQHCHFERSGSRRPEIVTASHPFPPGVPLVGNLRTRLLALHVLEAVLPSCESNMEEEQMTQVNASSSPCRSRFHGSSCSTRTVCRSQVVERLFSLLSDCMWEAPVAQAKHSAQIKEKVQELKLQVREPQSPSSPSRASQWPGIFPLGD